MSASAPTLPRLALASLLALALLIAFAPSAQARITTSFSGGILTIEGDDSDDQIAVDCGDDGTAKVNGANPQAGPLACAAVVEVNALGGPGNDLIDFRGIRREFGRAEFPGFGNRTGAAAVGGPGNDRYRGSRIAFNLFEGEDGDDRASGGKARDQLSGGDGDDRLSGGGGRDSLLGNAGADKLVGGDGADVLSGNAGPDLLIGGAGPDLLGGGSGNDRLRGGPGRDRLFGGLGRDRLNGGRGKDIEREKPPPAKP